jgi:uncharacterized membrane protein YsdA (DUF1294 family)
LTSAAACLALAAGLALGLDRLLAWPLWACVFGATSTVAFAAYGVDKQAARRGAGRIPENTLHLLALLGGAPGALAGMHVFRHKTAKRSFQLVFWAIVAAQAALLAYFACRG